MNIDNKLISDFMHSKMKNYHLSWDLIFPVIEKIESLDLSDYMYKWEDDRGMNYNFNYIDFEISTSLISVYIELDLDPPHQIHSVDMFKENKLSKLEAVYECVIEFITYYNILCTRKS